MFIIKIFGLSLIVASSTFMGVLKSCSLVARYKKILLLLDGANALYNFIEQGGYELEYIVKKSFSKCDFLSFRENRIYCDDNDLKDEKIFTNEFFAILGNSVKKIECDNINGFILKLKMCLKEAEKEATQKSKVYRTLGLCIGLVIAILLI